MSPYDVLKCVQHNVSDFKNKTINAIAGLHAIEPVGENFRNKVRDIVDDFQKRVVKEVKKNGWDGKDDTVKLQWSFAGALLYAVTVVTTIGKSQQHYTFQLLAFTESS